MKTVSIVLAISNISISILIIGISLPLVMGKIPMNQIYGIRFKKSFESEESWYKINHYGGKQLIIWSIALFTFGVLSLFFPLIENGFLTTLIAFAPLIFLVPAFNSYRYSKKL